MKKLLLILILVFPLTSCAAFINGFANGFSNGVNGNDGQTEDSKSNNKFNSDYSRYEHYQSAMEETNYKAKLNGLPPAPIMDFYEWKQAYGQ